MDQEHNGGIMSYLSFIQQRVAEFTTIEWLGLCFVGACLTLGALLVWHLFRICRDLDRRDGGIT